MAEGPAINDDVVLEMLIDDMQEHYGFSFGEATAWAKEHASSVVDDMWDAYTKYLEDYNTD
jgi:pyrroloquinoline quinone (PQQ) biosynthesis protein C